MPARSLLPLALSLLLCVLPAGGAAYYSGVRPNYSAVDSTSGPLGIVVSSDGVTITITWPVAMTRGGSWSGSNINVDGTDAGDNVTWVYSSGDGSTTWVGSISGATILQGATVDLDFDGGANAVEYGAGTDAAAFANFPAVNNSTQTPLAAADETFDPTGYDLTWVETVGTTVDEDFTGTGTRDGQSLRIVASGTADRTYEAFTATTEAWRKFYVYRVSNSGTTTIAFFGDGNSARVQFRFTSGGGFQVVNGSGTAGTTVNTLSTSSAAVVWVRGLMGSGANGIGEIAWQPFVDGTSEVRPTSGNYFAQCTDGTSTGTINRFFFGSQTTATHETIYDDLFIGVAGYP